MHQLCFTMLARWPGDFCGPVKLFGTRRVLSPTGPGKTGGPDATRFEAFVRTHQDMVFATAVRLLGRSAEAEDVTQDVFLKAYEHFATIGDTPTEAGWLRTVARNACLNHLSRYRSRWRLFSELSRPGEEDNETPGLATLAAPEPGDREAPADRLEQALRRLPDAQRVALVLFHFESISYQEIAQMLGISLGKVKTDIHRGREALKGMLTRDGTR
jgi:RNA polymerase sigma-70 factor (ECF subfamily)